MEPAFPSLPPPSGGSDDDHDGRRPRVKPMTLVAAGLWAFGAQLASLWLMLMFHRGEGSEGMTWDPVHAVLAQAAAFLLVIYGIVRVYAPTAPMRSVLGFTPSRRRWIYPLSMVAGVAAIFPVELAYETLLRWVPTEPPSVDPIAVFYTLSSPERVAIVVCLGAIGPLVEEMLFRGALMTLTLRRHEPTIVIVVTSTVFALVHVNLHGFLPYCLLGATLGYLRWTSGSMVPPLLFHMFYNGVPLVQLLLESGVASEDTSARTAAATVTPTVAIGGLVVWVACLAALRFASPGPSAPPRLAEPPSPGDDPTPPESGP
ncbi:MAG: type II CAAX endopeptidase family protein [Myxococcota bacterium]